MRYPGLFKAYQPLQGKDWLTKLPEDEIKAFNGIGMEENLHGVLGGRALVEQKGTEHMSSIGRVGACVANVKRWWRRRVAEETYEMGVLTYDEFID